MFLLLVLYQRLDDRSLCMEMGDIFVAVIICLFINFVFRMSADCVFLSVRIFLLFVCIDSVRICFS